MLGNEGRYRAAMGRVIEEGGSLASFEAQVGPTGVVEPLWYQFLLEQVKAARGPQTRDIPR